MQTNYDTRTTPIRSLLVARTPRVGEIVQLPVGLLYMNEFFAVRAVNGELRDVVVTERKADEFFWMNAQRRLCSAYFKVRSST